MASFLNQKLGTAFGHGVQALNQSVHTELRVGSHTVLVKERLAEGGFGFVDLVTEVNTQKDFVLKRCNVDRDEAFATVKKEINILQRFAGKYIVTLVDQDIITKNRTSREALLLLDHCPGGHLLDRLNQRQGSHLPAETVYRIFGQLLLALKPMHESNPPITHRDLKLENILFGQDGKLKLIDFGSCVEGPVYLRNPKEREAAEEIIAKETTQMYRAPEMCDTYMRQVLTEKTDIWALGCILYALCFLVHPFQNAGSLGILSAKINFPGNSPFSEDTHALILKMLDVDPEARWSVKELVEGTGALAGGRPLPDIPLSEEAVKRREERIAANTLRESKNQKKAVAAPPPRKVVPLDSNSVAAKRLAAKRGVASVGVTNSGKGGGNDFFDDGSSSPPAHGGGEVDFAPDFEAAPAVFAKQPSATFAANSDLFDDFGSSNFDDVVPVASSSSASTAAVRRPSFGADEQPPIKPAKKPISNAASLFDEVEDEVDPAVTITAAPSSSAAPQFAGGFDAFSDGPTASSGFDAFGGAIASFDAFGSASAPAPAAAAHHDAFEPSTFASGAGGDTFATRGSFTASTTAGGFDAFGHDDFTPSHSNDGSDPFGSSAPIARKPSVVTGKKPKPLPPTPAAAAAAAPPAAAFSLLDVSEVEEEPIQSVRSNSNHAAADLFAASEMFTAAPVSAPSTFSVGSGSNSNRNSFSMSGPPTFTDDLLIPASAPASSTTAAQPNRNSLSRDPSAVLSLFDMPKPEKPPKPVMLNTPPVMMMSGLAVPFGAAGGGPRGGMMTPPGPGGMMMGSPMGGAGGGPAMMGGGGGGFIPDPRGGGPRPPQQQFGMQSPQMHQQPQGFGMQQPQQGFGMQQPSPQQRQQQMGGGGLGTGMMQQPAFQTQKSVDPFDSINQLSMKRK